jgi:hypothetical protein
MARLFLILVALCLALVQPVYSKSSDEYLAVFSTRDFNVVADDWDQYEPNVYKSTTRWDEFEPFLKQVREETKKGQKVLLDLQTHGSEKFAICKRQGGSIDPRDWDERTAGWVFGKIDKYLGDRDLTVLMEACFGGYVYNTTIHQDGYDHIPTYPIYGNIDTCRGWNNCVFLQYYHHFKVTMVDLRMYEYHVPVTREPDACGREKILLNLRQILKRYGIQKLKKM